MLVRSAFEPLMRSLVCTFEKCYGIQWPETKDPNAESQIKESSKSENYIPCNHHPPILQSTDTWAEHIVLSVADCAFGHSSTLEIVF